LFGEFCTGENKVHGFACTLANEVEKQACRNANVRVAIAIKWVKVVLFPATFRNAGGP
jgi:hypothetical protein